MKRTLIVAMLLLPASLFAADVTGVFEPGTPYEPPAEHAPATVSRMFVRTLTNGAADLPAAGDSGMIIWTIGRTNARLTTPTGDVLRPNDFGSIERGLRRFRFDTSEAGVDLPQGTSEVFHVMRAEAASYRLEGDVAGALVVAAEPDSAIVLETWIAPLSRQPGEPVTLHARLRDGKSGISGARVTARLAPHGGAAGRLVELIERGDGIYTATLADLPSAKPGVWQARFEADGETATGVRFARTGSGELVAERGAARLIADSVRASRSEGVLRVTASADVAIPGAYRFDVIVASDSTALAWGEGVRQLSRGMNELALEIPLDATAASLQLDVRLLGLDQIGIAGRIALEVR